uniref:AT01532p1 n=1 Tax=Drosophila melanogaster TaxID=7227 RepID=G4LU28_DROME|nr:AT01532p1 [Drosophila melanogaster]
MLRTRLAELSRATTDPRSPINSAMWLVLLPGAAHMSSMRSPGCGSRTRTQTIEGRFCNRPSSLLRSPSVGTPLTLDCISTATPEAGFSALLNS